MPNGVMKELEWPSDITDIIQLLQQEPNRLFVFRAAKNWSQADVAGQFGLNIRTWGDWERGVRPIPGGQAIKVAKEIQKCLPTAE